ncbi:phage minor tail protein L [Pseudomonas sp. JL972]|uniref:phage minor tail protein L n=1 Tax=Stutzerimonas degradans TaxID=2968968 RepID=UPI0012D99BAD|nr:phage minor tail protein L [Stutzerimonas degradans]MTZ15114.1 phage minor tail protein L [Stutzerimonas degradans]
MGFNADVQLLEPGSEVHLLEVDCSAFGGDVLRFHGHAVAHTPAELAAAANSPEPLQAKSIWWQGLEYKAWPVKVDGLALDGEGAAPSPTLTVGNLDGSITALCMLFADLVQARVTVRTTFAHYLDARNFEAGNAGADPTQEKLQVWYIDQKTGESGEAVAFALSSPADVQGQKIPARQIHALCHWAMCGEYRGADCGYTGGPVADLDGTPTDDPARDRCGGLLSDCKARFGANNPLSHGGFPGAALLRQ